MVQEVRDIILSLDEVLLAFGGYQRVEPDFLPKGTIISCATTDNTVVLTMEMAYGGTKSRNELAVKGLDILKPLIRYCIENNIMLPRDGKKSIIIEHDQIVLHIELTIGAELPTALNPMHMNHVNKITSIGVERRI